MTKQDVIRQISQLTGLEPPLNRVVLDEVVKESLMAGEPIYIRRFGSFTLKRRASKVGRNISQNTAVLIGAHVVPCFKPSLEFINQVRAHPVIEIKSNQ